MVSMELGASRNVSDMNRSERRRQQKKAAWKTKTVQSANRSPGQHSQSIQQAMDQALRHHAAGRLADAERLYRRILQADPRQSTAWYCLGVIALQGGKNDSAVDRIAKALAIAPEHVEAHIVLGNALRELGKLEEAVASYRKALAIEPEYAEVHNNLGNALQELGKLDEAIACYRKTLAINPDYAEAHNNLGIALIEQDKLDEAVASYRKALDVKPGYAEAHSNLGAALRGLGKLDEAVASYHKALAVMPDYAGAHNNLGNALKDQGKLDDAVASYHKALAIMPDHAEAHNNLGNALRDQGKLYDAVASYHMAISFKPDHAEAHSNLGNALRDQGKLDDAVASYHRALTINFDNADVHSNLGYALKKQGKLDDAVSSFQKALSIKPDHARAHSYLGNTLQSLGKLDDAVASYRRALAIAPDYAEAHRHLGMAKKFSEYDNDIKAMEAAYAVPGLSDWKRMHLAFGLGKSFEDLRRYDMAFGFYLTGNTLKRRTFEYSIESIEKNFERLKELFTKDLFGRHQTAGLLDEAPIFILGMLRSGTTLVEQILASHANVYGAGEVQFLLRIVASRFAGINDDRFTEKLDQAGIGEFSSAGGEYLAMIREHAGGARFITDKNPYNFHLIGMIKLMLPKARIIHCCRDPRDTCLSIFKNYFSADDNYYAYDLGELGLYYNLYRDLMRHWHSVLPDFIYDIHYEQLVADQEGQSRALLAHCGLEWDDACLDFHRTDRVVMTASAAQVRRPIYQESVRSWKHYEDQLAPLLDALGSG
jgi:tetratricopeptide (TPR) repeat protein